MAILPERPIKSYEGTATVCFSGRMFAMPMQNKPIEKRSLSELEPEMATRLKRFTSPWRQQGDKSQ